MRVHWHNVIALLFTIGALVLFVRFRRPVAAIVEAPAAVGPGHSMDEKVIGLLTLGLILVFIVGVVKILTRDRDD